MNKHEGCYRGYTLLSECYYANTSLENAKHVDEVNFGFFHTDGGTTGEMMMRWYDLNGEIVPRLEVFNDSWNALRNMEDLIEELSDVDGDNITPKEFCAILNRLGFKDDTKCISPYETVKKDMIVVQDERGFFRLLGYENGQYGIVLEIAKAENKEDAKRKFRKLGYDIK